MSEHIERVAAPELLFGDVANLQAALMISALILYARATHTSGSTRERGSIQLQAKTMTPQQQDDHRALIRLRNEAIAHVNASEQIAGDHWHANYLFAKRVEKGTWPFASGSTSIGFNTDAVRILKRQIPVATDALRVISGNGSMTWGTRCERRESTKIRSCDIRLIRSNGSARPKSPSLCSEAVRVTRAASGSRCAKELGGSSRHPPFALSLSKGVPSCSCKRSGGLRQAQPER